jgi:hypothetical protein
MSIVVATASVTLVRSVATVSVLPLVANMAIPATVDGPTRGGDPPADLLVHEVVGRSAVRDDDGSAAGQRLQCGKTEPLAPVGLHHAVGETIKARHLARGEVAVGVGDRRPRRVGGELGDARSGMVGIDGPGAGILDDEADVVVGREGPYVGVEQDVDALAVDRAAREKEDERLASLRPAPQEVVQSVRARLVGEHEG